MEQTLSDVILHEARSARRIAISPMLTSAIAPSRTGHWMPSPADWVNSHTPQQAAEKIQKTTAGKAVYLTVDIDCLDPEYSPGTDTPVAGGLSTSCLLQIIRGLVGVNIVAADVMEVAPAYDHAEITSLAAATIALELLHVHAANTRPGKVMEN